VVQLGVRGQWPYRADVVGRIFPSEISERRFGRLILAFVVVGFLSLLMAGVGAAVIMNLSEDRNAWVSHTYEVENHIIALRFNLERMASARRGYLLDENARFRAAYAESSAAAATEVDDLERLTSDNPRQRGAIQTLRPQVVRLRSILDASIAAAATGARSGAVRNFVTDGSAPLTREVQQVTGGMLAEEQRLLRQRIAAQAAYVGDFFAILVLCAVLLVLVAAGSVWVILRYTRELARSRDDLRGLNDNLEQAVQERTTDLQRANDEIQRFAYIVSHDLRSPLVNVLGFTSELDAAARPIAELLDRVEAEAPALVSEAVRLAVREDIPEAIGFIRGSTQKMDRLINAILKLSREGRGTVSPEPLNMDDLAQGIADSLRHRVTEAGAEILVEKPLPKVTTDRVALEQILSNLTENAVKYLKPGRPGRIVIRGRRELGKVVYEVADNGRGIDPKDHERVFDLFRRSGVQDQPGEGIGLAHVRASAYRLGGIVTCESALDEGAVFRVSLPAAYSGEISL
jgi:signal transduction histidine kinase